MSKLSRNEKAMLFAQGIVERYKARGNKLPHRSKTCRMDPNRVQVMQFQSYNGLNNTLTCCCYDYFTGI